jgi:hypothetical protein
MPPSASQFRFCVAGTTCDVAAVFSSKLPLRTIGQLDHNPLRNCQGDRILSGDDLVPLSLLTLRSFNIREDGRTAPDGVNQR